MRKVYLLDCTLRDGGYVNDWRFGEDAIRGIAGQIANTGIEMIEMGFIKGDLLDKDRSVFPDVESVTPMITPKSDKLIYAAMVDMSAPIPMERITPRRPEGIDAIRVIFKKDKMDLGYEYCKHIKDMGYMLFVNFVGTDLYTDEEFIHGIERFNKLKPFGMTIVDTFGLIKRKQFLRLCYLADNNMDPDIVLGYHAHNNLQQAFGNAEALVELNMKRDLCIDACVFGMGRGAGNLNLELFAEYMNENHETDYRIEPILEIMDRYLNDIYKTRFWGYSLPFYLSASRGVHPNYAIYLANRDSLTVKGFEELLSSMTKEDKVKFSKEKAEEYYRRYLENHIDDSEALKQLSMELKGKRILVLAPGHSLTEHKDEILKLKSEPDTVTIAVNFLAEDFAPDYIFSSNMRRYERIEGRTGAKCITTSNMKECKRTDYIVNFSSYSSREPEIIDNSGLMLLKLLRELQIPEVMIFGMDGYSEYQEDDYYDRGLRHHFPEGGAHRNELIAAELRELSRFIRLRFMTPSCYEGLVKQDIRS